MDNNQNRVNRRRRNLPAELTAEMVNCLPLENAVNFLANVLVSRLIIHHCAPHVSRMLEIIEKIVTDYASTLPAPDDDGDIWLDNGHQYTPEMGVLLRYGAAKCGGLFYERPPRTNRGFVGYPDNFFDDLIKHYYETKVPTKAVHAVGIDLPLNEPAPWPTTLVQPQAGEMKLEELKAYTECKYSRYILRNKHNPAAAFELMIYFEGEAKCYQQMTSFSIETVDAQTDEIK